MFVIVLFSLLIISIIGIAALIAYKAFCIGRDGVVSSEGKSIEDTLSEALKGKLLDIFGYIHIRNIESVFTNARSIHSSFKKNISDMHATLSDTANDKNHIGRRGAASFFLKSVAEHKKGLHKNRD